jgi:hypothetical protein
LRRSRSAVARVESILVGIRTSTPLIGFLQQQ